MGKSTPKPPSPYEQANAQSAANEKAVYASSEVNAIPQTTPFGSVSFDYTTKSVPEYDSKGRVTGYRDYQTPSGQTVTLAPQYQALLDQQTNFASQLGDKSNEILGQIPTDRFSLDSIGDTSDIAKTMYDRQYSLLKPQIEEQQNALTQLMSDRGIPIGAEIWNNEQDRFQRGVGESLNRLSQDSDLASRNEFQRQLQNALLERQQPLSEFAALQGQTPNFPTPQAQQLPAYNIQAPDIAGYMSQNYANQLAASGQQQAGVGSLLGGLFSLGAFL